MKRAEVLSVLADGYRSMHEASAAVVALLDEMIEAGASFPDEYASATAIRDMCFAQASAMEDAARRAK